MSLITKKKNIPKLRFKEFNDSWHQNTLENIGKLLNGLTYSPKDISDNGVLVLRSSNIKNNQLSLSDNVYVNANSFNPVKENDILICVRNGSKKLIGKNCLIDKKNQGVAFGAFMTVFRSANNKFVIHLFSHSSYFKKIYKNLGATINSINNNDLKKFKFFFPCLKEQQKIASFLSTVDEKLQQLSKKKKLLKNYKKGLMQKIFSQEIRFKDDNGNRFPDWKEKKLSDFCHKESSNLSASECTKNSGIYTVYGASGVYTYIDSFDNNEEYIAIVKDGSGVGNLIFCEKNSSVIGTLDILKPKNINLKFLYYLLSKVNFNKYKVGSSIPHIYFRDYKKLKKMIPSNNEQQMIADFLTAIDKKIEIVSHQLEKNKEFKKGLLQQMFV